MGKKHTERNNSHFSSLTTPLPPSSHTITQFHNLRSTLCAFTDDNILREWHGALLQCYLPRLQSVCLGKTICKRCRNILLRNVCPVSLSYTQWLRAFLAFYHYIHFMLLDYVFSSFSLFLSISFLATTIDALFILRCKKSPAQMYSYLFSICVCVLARSLSLSISCFFIRDLELSFYPASD